jgi:hypothetical protein
MKFYLGFILSMVAGIVGDLLLDEAWYSGLQVRYLAGMQSLD